MRGSLPQDVDFEPFFATWFASIRHIAHLLSKQPVFDLDDDSSDDVLRLADPVLGLDEAGEVVPWQDAAVPLCPSIRSQRQRSVVMALQRRPQNVTRRR